jgi:hypothetical protein
MAAEWVNEVMTQAIRSRNPETELAREYLRDEHDIKVEELKVKKAETIEIIEAKLKKAIKRQASKSVLDAYKALLNSYRN